MKKILFGVIVNLTILSSCQISNSEAGTDAVQGGETIESVQPEVVFDHVTLEPHQDTFFPRFSITKEEFEKMKELYETCTLAKKENCELQIAEYQFDQPHTIAAVHGNAIQMVKGRYDSLGMERYQKLRRLDEKDSTGWVVGYATELYTIVSKNPATKGKIFYYDLASICPPPPGVCVKGVDTTKVR